MVPDESIGKLEEEAEAAKMLALKKALTEEEKQSIVQDAYQLKKHQETLQDLTVLPSLGLDDIQK